ncbi:hypothetical protein GKC32_10925 (plasmid) [Lactobacillus curvatus]|nr:hypothetical protein [Latilactobacillus curvatus]MSD84750.1 hypothetical protein [Latilactobacillus curvatus]MSE23486.1 hypothetical protein [Latilactobacillus curvatus]MSE24950.1 hypothetical protein [Latilactobacillus curvatus]
MANNPSENKDGTTAVRANIIKVNGKNVSITAKLNQTDSHIFYFSDLNQENDALDGKYELLHFYQNGSIGTDLVVKPAETVTKTKHGVTRTVAGGVIGGIPGAVIGATTAKKVSATKAPLTTTVRDPNNAILIFKDTTSGIELSVELSLGFMRELERLNKFIEIKSEFK